MRTKTRAPHPTSSKSPLYRSSTAVLRPLPRPDDDDGGEEDGVDLVYSEISSENDEPVVINGKRKNRRRLDDCEDEVDWLDEITCLVCNRGAGGGGRGKLLVCSETGCPLGFHEKCLQFKPKFDDLGRFYCPYCWYKRDAQRKEQLRRKKGLLDFSGAKEKGNGSTVTLPSGERDSGEHSNGLGFDGEVENESVQVEEADGNVRERVVGGSEEVYNDLEGKARGIEVIEESMFRENIGGENGCEAEEHEVLVDEEEMDEDDDGHKGTLGIVKYVEPLSVYVGEEEEEEEEEEGEDAGEDEKIQKNVCDEENKDGLEEGEEEIHHANSPEELSPQPHTKTSGRINKVNSHKMSREPQKSAETT